MHVCVPLILLVLLKNTTTLLWQMSQMVWEPDYLEWSLGSVHVASSRDALGKWLIALRCFAKKTKPVRQTIQNPETGPLFV